MAEVTGEPRARAGLTSVSGDGLVLHLEGELDLAAMPAVQPVVDRLLEQPPQPLCVDVSGLRFMDSSGVTVLIRVANHFRPIELRHASPTVRRVVEVLGLAEHLGLRGD
jgi:anti-sigma B factor antagonist